MARDCRDCETCTSPGAVRLGMAWAVGFLHLCTVGISLMVKGLFMRNCPHCRHLLSRHQRRADGSFRD